MEIHQGILIILVDKKLLQVGRTANVREMRMEGEFAALPPYWPFHVSG